MQDETETTAAPSAPQEETTSSSGILGTLGTFMEKIGGGDVAPEKVTSFSDKLTEQGGLTIDTSNSHLETLSDSALLEKRKALMWMSTSGAAQGDSAFFFHEELGPIEDELKKRGVSLP